MSKHSVVLAAAVLLMAILGHLSASEILGPGRFLKDISIYAEKTVSFNLTFSVVNASGPSAFEAAFVKGPYRLGFILIYTNNTLNMYIMRGDQNSWIRIGRTSVLEEVRASVYVDLEKHTLIFRVDNISRSFNYTMAGDPESFRLAVIPLSGNITIRVEELVLSIDGEEKILVEHTTTTPLATSTTTTTTGTTPTPTTTNTSTTTSPPEGKAEGLVIASFALIVITALCVAYLLLRSPS